MDIDEANKYLKPPPIPQQLHFDQTRAKLAHHHQDAPQRAMLADMALAQAQEAITRLASLGHRFYLVEGEALPPLEWPKMVYHRSQAPRIVASQQHLDELGPGWFDHPEKALTAEALAVQAEGRGGIPKTTLPAPIPPAPIPTNGDGNVRAAAGPAAKPSAP